MIRALLVTVVWLCSLCTLSIRVRFADGWTITLVGWPEALSNRRKKKESPDGY